MKRCICLLFSLILLFSGCMSAATSRASDAFAFDLPGGYTITDRSDTDCAIIGQEGTPVGGIVLTGLTAKDLRKNSPQITQYFDSRFPGCECAGWKEGNFWNPIYYTTITVRDPNAETESQYYSILFRRNGQVYDLWFDLSKIEKNQIQEFDSVMVSNAK